jgi:MFS transporter, NNP family, nitrate/nitrite transporter
MPAVFDSLVQDRGLTAHKAWRVAYIVPFIIIVAVALGMLFTCDDTPTGKWSERAPLIIEGTRFVDQTEGGKEGQTSTEGILTSRSKAKEDKEANYNEANKTPLGSNLDAQLEDRKVVDDIKGEVIVPPTLKEVLYVVSSMSTLALAAQYACSFGAELALDGVLGSYYETNFPQLGQTKCGQWAAMFGLLNVIFRPLGGYVSDLVYRQTSSLWAKKLWLVFLGVVTGGFLLAVGLSNPKTETTMFGLFAGLSFFLEAANGANFSLVPHVYPAANGEWKLKNVPRVSADGLNIGIVSGTVGAAGNLGGIIFNIIFRYNGVYYDRSVWIMGVICIAVNFVVSWIQPVPK